jgi:CBS domain-containing membrane protein
VGLAIFAMALTHTMHPPGGATALVAVVGDKTIRDLGFLYVLLPILSSALIMLVIALLMNNLSPRRAYPVTWFIA